MIHNLFGLVSTQGPGQQPPAGLRVAAGPLPDCLPVHLGCIIFTVRATGATEQIGLQTA